VTADRPYSLHLFVLLQRWHASKNSIVAFAVDLVQQVNLWQVEMGWPDIHWLARETGGLVAAMFEAGFELSLVPMEPELAPCGWRCRPPPAPHCDGVN
jgi:hypothetical protein